MERLVLGASKTLDISLHVFSAATKCGSDEARAQSLEDWGDLLCDALLRGVSIRLLLNDFDAIGGSALHAKVWLRLDFLAQRVVELPASARANLQIQVAHPGGRAGALVKLVLWPFVRARTRVLLADYRDESGRPLPGFMDLLNKYGRVRAWPPKDLYTQTLHQKFMIADEVNLIIGGMDVDERRFDDPNHQRSAPETWHDVNVVATGPVVTAALRHFAETWNAVRKYGATHSEAFVQRNEVAFRCRSVFDIQAAALVETDERTNRLTLVTTTALPSAGLTTFGPITKIDNLENAHVKLISEARHLIYIETQFFRSSTIVEALAARGLENADLHVILLLPGAPDVVAFEGKESSVHRYGEWLQSKALDRMETVFGARFGVFCLTNSDHREEHVERDALHNKSMVYIHSKVMLADDRVGIVSSANLNGRSMRWDYEAGVLLTWPSKVKQLRERLWGVHLGSPARTSPDNPSGASSALDLWTSSAIARAALKESALGCGVVPFPRTRTRRFSKRHFFLAEELV